MENQCIINPISHRPITFGGQTHRKLIRDGVLENVPIPKKQIPPRIKRPLTAAQRAGLEKGQRKLAQIRAEQNLANNKYEMLQQQKEDILQRELKSQKAGNLPAGRKLKPKPVGKKVPTKAQLAELAKGRKKLEEKREKPTKEEALKKIKETEAKAKARHEIFREEFEKIIKKPKKIIKAI